jgi:hypothetical protein
MSRHRYLHPAGVAKLKVGRGPDLPAILIQKDDAKAQGISANLRQKNRATWQGQR